MLLTPDISLLERLGSGYTSTTLTASTHRITLVGVIRDAGTINRVGFRLGTVAVAATTTLTVSLQDVDTTTGPPGRPDGTPDQSGTVAAGSFSSNQWINVTLTSTRTVSIGDQVAVVVEFGTFNVGDSVNVVSLAASGVQGLCHLSFFDGSTWTASNSGPNCTLGYSSPSGTSSSFASAIPASSITTNVYNVNTLVADERGIQWIPTVSTRVAGILAMLATVGNFEAILYEGTTALATALIDEDATKNTSRAPFAVLFASPVAVTAGQTYYLAIRPTAAQNVTFLSYGLDSAEHRGAWPMGTEAAGATRLDQGTWSTSTTTMYPIVPIVEFPFHRPTIISRRSPLARQ